MAETRDYFAELYVAGLMADAGWNIYFPHRVALEAESLFLEETLSSFLDSKGSRLLKILNGEIHDLRYHAGLFAASRK